MPTCTNCGQWRREGSRQCRECGARDSYWAARDQDHPDYLADLRYSDSTRRSADADPPRARSIQGDSGTREFRGNGSTMPQETYQTQNGERASRRSTAVRAPPTTEDPRVKYTPEKYRRDNQGERGGRGVLLTTPRYDQPREQRPYRADAWVLPLRAAPRNSRVSENRHNADEGGYSTHRRTSSNTDSSWSEYGEKDSRARSHASFEPDRTEPMSLDPRRLRPTSRSPPPPLEDTALQFRNNHPSSIASSSRSQASRSIASETSPSSVSTRSLAALNNLFPPVPSPRNAGARAHTEYYSLPSVSDLSSSNGSSVASSSSVSSASTIRPSNAQRRAMSVNYDRGSKSNRSVVYGSQRR